jgi:hypothetical protein
MGWDSDKELSDRAILYQDAIYSKLFQLENIHRFQKSDNIILDRKYHIDVELQLVNGIKLLGQEKGLRFEHSHFNTLTIEFYQNRHTKEQGEFFNLGAQFYLSSYWNSTYTGFLKWYFIKIFDFLSYLKREPIEELEKHTRPSTSNASFYYINYNDIPRQFIYRFNDTDVRQV